MNWRKSSYSGQGSGNCVSVGDHANHVLVRDTKDPSGPMLRVASEVWRKFADRVKGDVRLAPDDVLQREPF